MPRNRGRVTTLLAGLTLTGVGPTRTRLGGTTKEAFLAFLRTGRIGCARPSRRPEGGW